MFGDGLMGKMVSGMINQAASGLKEQMSAAAEATEVTYDSAVRACKMDGRVRSALGDDVQATPPMSQMSSSTNVNGVASQQTSVGFLLQSSTGRRAQVQAVSTTTNGVVTVDATVVTETGEQFVIPDCGGGDDVWRATAAARAARGRPPFRRRSRAAPPSTSMPTMSSTCESKRDDRDDCGSRVRVSNDAPARPPFSRSEV